MKGSTGSSSRDVIIGAVSVAVVLILWDTAVRTGALDPIYVSSPSRIASAAMALAGDPSFHEHLAVSGTEFLTGFGAAVILGIPLGLLAGTFPRLGYTIEPTLTAAYVTPRSSLLPALVLWFGYGPQTTSLIVFLGAFFVLFLNVMVGASTADAQLIRAARSFSASKAQIFKTIIVPHSVPNIVTGLRLAVGRALIGVVIGEIYAASAGLGYFIHISGITLQIDKMFVAIIGIGAAGLISNLLFSMLERRSAPWRQGLREL
jgi:NitT/TauT family transport system permease protein